MSQSLHAFQKNKKIFYEQLISAWQKSPDYVNIGDELDTVLLLADRVLAACQEDLEFNRALNIASIIEQAKSGRC